VGFDLSVLSLKNAKRRFPSDKRLDVIMADADFLPFRSNAFDAIYCNATLHHMRNFSGVLANFRKLARNKGYLVVVEPGILNPLLALARRILPSNIHTIGERPFVYGSLNKALAATGWVVESSTYYVFLNTLLLPASKLLKLRIAPFGMAASRVDDILSRSFLRELFWFACVMGSAKG
jgi:SAM-dependent methyltransferase